ncbi:MAG: 2Fe-2S iron-sulfur cluster-binding protein [Bdellovibrionota bacterium]|nr:MAG: 2Fe-2S iron-sulfur cluster-binding protein [Bdellovibrionota bacterium]
MSAQNGNSQELVTLSIDGKEVRVPKGTNVIEAARSIGVEIPYYCYHPHLSVAGNCRMCQVKVEGQPKLQIGCNTPVAEGMKVLTSHTSAEVSDAQAATLEFILINHPLDCTVCDQAGHCKLQDYHYEYNARPSRFLEEKVHKVKAEPLGPTVMLDGERCVLCTRCVRFCDEVTKTSELGVLNRGDRSVIAINEGRELNNPFSGTVVDLCPVGALTHRQWRFNTRIWFTQETESICPGCSTGCNVKVAVRDGEVVQVKARLNSDVNKEWLCDEGRYGFGRFIPKERVLTATVEGREAPLSDALLRAKQILGEGPLTIFVSPALRVEDYAILKKFVDGVKSEAEVVLAYRERSLSALEQILIAPDYAANLRGFEFALPGSRDHQARYTAALQKLASGSAQSVLFLGDLALSWQDQSLDIAQAITKNHRTVAMISDHAHPAARSTVVLPTTTPLEQAGLLINRAQRLQYAEKVMAPPSAAQTTGKWLTQLAQRFGLKLSAAVSDRDLSIEYLGSEPRLLGLRIAAIKPKGIDLTSFKPGEVPSHTLVEATSLA